MPAGSAQLAKRALVTLLLSLARKYDIPAVVVNRDSPDAVVLATFKKVSKKVHPDKGGSTQDFPVVVCRSLGTHPRKLHSAGTKVFAISMEPKNPFHPIESSR